MSDIEGKKRQRSAAKRAVTMTARKLTFSIHCDGDMDILKTLMFELEKAYADFCVLNEEYEELVIEESNAKHRIVNGEDIVTYRMNVNQVYQEAQREFMEMKATDQLKFIISRDIVKLRELSLDIELNLYSGNPDWPALQSDKDKLQPIMDAIGDGMAKLCSVQVPSDQVNEYQQKVDEVIGSAYKLNREIKQCLRVLNSVKESSKSTESHLTAPISSVISPSSSKYVSLEESVVIVPVSSTHTATGMVSSTHSAVGPVSSTQEAQLLVSSTQMGTPLKSSTHSVPMSSTQASSQIVSTTQGAQGLVSSTQGAQGLVSSTQGAQGLVSSTQGAQGLVSSTQTATCTQLMSSTYTAAVPVSSTQASTKNVYSRQSYADPSAQLNATFTVSDNTVEDFSSQTTLPWITSTTHRPIHTQPNLAYVPFGTLSTSTPISYACTCAPTVHMRRENDSTYVVSGTLRNQLASPVVSQSEHVPFAAPCYDVTYSSLTSPVNGVQNGFHPQNVIEPSTAYETSTRGKRETSTNSRNIQIKKISLPIFTGYRKDWPEFRAVWKELAEGAFQNKTALAHELKRSVHGEAAQRIKSVYVTKPEAYDIMWKKLEAHYSDTSASVQAALEDLHKLKPITEGDYKGLIELVDAVESSYSQLEEQNQINTLTMRDVDFVNELLPVHLKVEWIRKYHDMSSEEKIRPFHSFMRFLEREREAVARLAEIQVKRKKNTEFPKANDRSKSQTHHGAGQPTSQPKKQYHNCAYHRKDSIKHTTSDCKEFQKLPVTGSGGKYEVLKQVNACFICFGEHQRKDCPNKKPCKSCGSEEHHPLLCKSEKSRNDPRSSNHVHVEGTTNASRCSGLALYPIQQAKVSESGKTVTVFSDGGSNTTYITHRAADRINAKVLNQFTLDVTTMGNVEKTYNTRQYQFTLVTNSGKKVVITAFGMDQITSPISKLNVQVVSELFPKYDPESLQRKTKYVDVLLGCDYYGLHPKHEEAKCGDNLSIMRGELGICLQGTHPKLTEETMYASNLVKTIHDSRIKLGTYHVRLDSHPEFQPRSTDTARMDDADEMHVSCHHTTKSTGAKVENFINGEELGAEVTPRCGGCRCGKCPTTGHTFSFKEEQELKMIQENLEYDEENQCWITSYPWKVDPSTLPNNYGVALGTLKSTERTLSKDQQWAETYQKQMEDMVNRKVARKLSDQEMQEWEGPVFYISHLAVLNPRTNSTPVRIVFNSSQVCQGKSLNSCLAKGPDCYMNNLIGILLRWREGQAAIVGDIRKMFNSIHLKPLEQHCHRFLWRDLQSDRNPDVYVMTRVNMGDRPAPAISTEAIYKTADLFMDESPQASKLLKTSNYVDDLIDSCASKSEALKLCYEVEKILAKGGFKVKCWQLSGESNPRVGDELLDKSEVEVDQSQSETTHSLLKGTDENLRVLGLGWNPKEDTVVYEVNLNFSKKHKGVRIEPNLVETDIPKAIPPVLTRRIVLGQVMMIYDPLGFICPFTLLGKINLRETWSQKLDWDDPLPRNLHAQWVRFFSTLFELQRLKLDRCLQPPNAVGKPWLVILSDGSDLAYGCAAYVRWQLDNGDYWCRLIMAKCRIAPINKLSTPQMELNAAVLSKRARKVLEAEMRFEFERVLHIVDSETVLSMINKTSTRFKVYEGVRIGEIQAATNGDVSCWAWMSGQHNTADWLTRGRRPKALNQESQWWNGPPILYEPEEKWGLKFGRQKEEPLPGEKKICSSNTAIATSSLIDYKRFSSINKIIWIVARLQNVARHRSFSGGRTELVSAKHLKEAEEFIVKDVQQSLAHELSKTDQKKGKGGRYASLNPTQNQNGLWVVGERLSRHNPMTLDSSAQKLLPADHPATRLFMQRAHENGHRGRDGTLAVLRTQYWVPHGSKVARSVKRNCQLCKLREATFLEQQMGHLPEVRLKPAPAFNNVMLDLFGPYQVRGEVQKRTSGKAYGVIFTDMAMRAVHIEAVFGYDTSSFLMALSRFASVHGWPERIYSDPGSQLIGAAKELESAWNSLDRQSLVKNGAERGLTWIFGPADSSWYQGAVESLVKSAKRAIHFSLGHQRLSAPEFLTVCYEVSNLLNERPIGTQPSTDSTLNILTPNSLLLGRARAINPLGWQPYDPNIRTRYHLVQVVTAEFWKRWTELYAPILLIRRKWHTSCRNLRVGDVVLVADKNTFRGEYRLGLVKEATPDQDGKVRRVTITYKNYRVGEDVREYKGTKDVAVTRAVQRLALLVPVEDDPEEQVDAR